MAQSRGQETLIPTEQTQQETKRNLEETQQPRRLAITVKIAEPQDLKVRVGSQVKAGQIIASRDREKQRLEAQKTQLNLSLSKLQSYQPLPPTPPNFPPAIKALPPNSYLEQEAMVEKTKTAIASIESQIEVKEKEIEYLQAVENLDPIILDHERVKLNQLKLKHTEAIRDYQLAIGKLQTAKDSRAYQEYQASLAAAQRVEQMNAVRSSYERQLAEYQQQLAGREFQEAQLKGKLNEVENAIANLSMVKSPYDGTVRRIKWLGQSPDGSLTAEITLIVRNRNNN
jgi:biotin carboxyl carrier protein